MQSQKLGQLILKSFEQLPPQIVINGFKASGLYPWDPSSIDYSKCLGKRFIREDHGENDVVVSDESEIVAENENDVVAENDDVAENENLIAINGNDVDVTQNDAVTFDENDNVVAEENHGYTTKTTMDIEK